jgi:tRNA(Ile)-lysidine synthase
VLVAVSGGADSTALLLGLHHLAHALGLELHAAHLHHGLRGADADRDLAFVRALCRRLRIPLAWRRIDARAGMARRRLSGQDGLRRLRREFLRAEAARAGAAAIATAHQADDQLETLLMRLARGTGASGLGGIPPRRGLWIRPLLQATRADVEHDLRVAGQPWREDRSNRDPAYLRNRLRHRAIPALVAAIEGGRLGPSGWRGTPHGWPRSCRARSDFWPVAPAGCFPGRCASKKGNSRLIGRWWLPTLPRFSAWS